MNNINSPFSMPDFFSMFGSFILVLLLLGVVLFILKKVQMTSSTSNGGRKIQIVEVMPTSNKQKIMLIKVEDQQFLVGVSGQNLNQLGQWTASKPIPEIKKHNHNILNDHSETALEKNTHKMSDIHETVKQNSEKQSRSEVEKIKPIDKPTIFDKRVNKLTKISSIKQTENLLSFAQQIRCTLNQSINKTQRIL